MHHAARGSLRSRIVPPLLMLVSSTFPGLAAGQGVDADSDSRSGNLIRYRTLERADFMAAAPPEFVHRGDFELAASTCASISTEFSIHVDTDGELHEGWLEGLRFEAFLDRSCSWWDPNGLDPDYTLQHEQIHFAIYEVAARRLNQSVAGLARDLRVTAGSHGEVVEQLRARLAAVFAEHEQAAFERNRAFDADASRRRDGARQRQWWQQLERELLESEAWR